MSSSTRYDPFTHCSRALANLMHLHLHFSSLLLAAAAVVACSLSPSMPNNLNTTHLRQHVRRYAHARHPASQPDCECVWSWFFFVQQIRSFFMTVTSYCEAVCFFARLDALVLPMRIRFVILDILFCPACRALLLLLLLASYRHRTGCCQSLYNIRAWSCTVHITHYSYLCSFSFDFC